MLRRLNVFHQKRIITDVAPVVLLNHGDARSRLFGNPILVTAKRQDNWNECVSGVVTASEVNLQHAEHAREFSPELILIHRAIVFVGKHVICPVHNEAVRLAKSFNDVGQQCDRSVVGVGFRIVVLAKCC